MRAETAIIAASLATISRPFDTEILTGAFADRCGVKVMKERWRAHVHVYIAPEHMRAVIALAEPKGSEMLLCYIPWQALACVWPRACTSSRPPRWACNSR